MRLAWTRKRWSWEACLAIPVSTAIARIIYHILVSMQCNAMHPTNQPLFRAPQISHRRMAPASPVDSWRRFPQSVQKIKDPIADILTVSFIVFQSTSLIMKKKIWQAKFSAAAKICSGHSPPWPSAGRSRAAAARKRPSCAWQELLLHSPQQLPNVKP